MSAALEPEEVIAFALIDPLLLERAYRLGVGSAVLAAASGGRILGPAGDLPVDDLVDFGVGLSDSVFDVVQRSVAAASRTVSPVAGLVREPARRLLSGLGRMVAPAVAPVQERGRQRRAEAEAEVASLVQALIPEITDLIMERIDFDAVLAQIDLQELVEASVAHVDMASVVANLDMAEVTRAMMSQLDLTQLAVDHIDMNRIMDRAIKQVDVVALVRSQLEGVDMAELIIGTPTSIASGALRQTTRFVRRG